MKIRYLLLILIIAIITGLIGLGISQQYVVNSAQHIIALDKVGSPTEAEIAVLTAYVHTHTRASVTFSLDGSYQRAVQAAELASQPQANASVYPIALSICQVKNPVTTAQCIQNYVQTHAPAGSNPQPVVLPDHNTFVYSIDSPAWAPDLAGISFLVAFVSFVLAIWFRLVGRKSSSIY
ncbi:MAG: hypothetical protein ACHQUB_02970 [Candidatus Saccharimonadia bacterium]